MRRKIASGAGLASRKPSASWALSSSAASRAGDQTEVPAGSHAGEAASHQTGAASADASTDSCPRKMAGTGRQGLLQLSRRADQQSGACCVPLPGHQTLATIAQAAQSERWYDLGADHAAGQRLVPQTAHPSSMAGNTLRRHAPKVGEAMGRAAEVVAPSSSIRTDGGCPVAQVNDLSRSLTAFDPISTLVVVVEMSKASWLVSGVVPGVERQPLKKLEPDATALLRLIERWRNEAVRAGRPISRIGGVSNTLSRERTKRVRRLTALDAPGSR